MHCFSSLSAVLLLLCAIRSGESLLLASNWKTQLLPVVDAAAQRVGVLLQPPPARMNLSQLRLHLRSDGGDEFAEDIFLPRDLILINGTSFGYHYFGVPSTNKPCITTYTLTVRGYYFHNGSYCSDCRRSQTSPGCHFKVGSGCESPRCTEVDSLACPLPPAVAANVKALGSCQQPGPGGFPVGVVAAAAAAAVAATVAALCLLRARFHRRHRVHRIFVWVSQELLDAPPPPVGLLGRLRLQNPLLQQDIGAPKLP